MKTENDGPVLSSQEILALAAKTSAGVDKLFELIEHHTPDEMVVLLTGAVLGVVEYHPETLETAIWQLEVALKKIKPESEPAPPSGRLAS